MSDTPRTDAIEEADKSAPYPHALRRRPDRRTLERELARCRLALANEADSFAKELAESGDYEDIRQRVIDRATRLRDLSQPTPEDLA